MRLKRQTKYRALNLKGFKKTKYWGALDPGLQRDLTVASAVLPFRCNEYILDELIDWSNVPDDPIFQLTFPQRGMLNQDDFHLVDDLIDSGASSELIITAVNAIRTRMNPHPAGQVDHNVPVLNGRRLEGLQHKYHETVLYFSAKARTCHAYCTFCFRWPLLVEHGEHNFDSPRLDDLRAYLSTHQEVTDVLFSGGDPMVMSARALERHIEPLLDPRFEHVQSIRIGTKSPAYWPHRYVDDRDADDILRLFERVVRAGRHLALMAHYSHPVELSTPLARRALRRIGRTGAAVRMQAPLVRYVNDDPDIWADLWRDGVRCGAIPYYMFVERDTGPKHYFELPLRRALMIYKHAYRQVSGLAKTVRGPSMSAFFGKARIVGTVEMHGKKVFALEYIQARDPDLVSRLFFADFDPEATWFDELVPAFERDRRFFIGAEEYAGLMAAGGSAD